MLLLVLATLGCEDKDKIAQDRGRAAVERLLPLVERDTKQVREGLPEGAESMGTLLDEDPGADPAALQRAIKQARASVEALAFAKSTFFIFVSAEGTVLRSETDPDLPAGQSLYEAIEATQALSKPKAGLVEAFGFLHGLRGIQKGPDRQWVVGHPVRDADGEAKGSFVTGWSLRAYARYLEDDTRRFLTSQSSDKLKASPLLYVFVVHDNAAFGALVTPEVNGEALGKLEITSKLAAGSFQASVDVDGRKFWVVAVACPALGEKAALAVMISPV